MQVLVATGGAAHSDTAVRLGAFLTHKTDSRLTLLTVIPAEEDRPQAEAVLKRAAILVAEYQVVPQKQICIGTAANEIARAAQKGSYDLVVLGDRPGHRLLKRLLGPTAERVIAHMSCPVLIARQEKPSVKRLLLCEGGRDPSLLERLQARLLPLLRVTEEVTILHVMSQMTAAPGVPGWELRADAAELMARHTREGELLAHDAAVLESLPLHLQAKVRHGLVVDEVLEEARDGHYDLVVIGAHQGSGWERFLLDDLAHQIVSKIDTSVLVI
jgi:nucleotide-binding universal stress UspA family protein